MTASTLALRTRPGSEIRCRSSEAAFARLLRWAQARVNGGHRGCDVLGRPLEFKSLAITGALGMSRPEMLAVLDDLIRVTEEQRPLNNLLLGLRLGEKPRTIVTTTPQPGPRVRRVLALPRSIVTHGRLEDNLHTSDDYKEQMREIFGGTRLAPAELEGILLEDYEGALWTREMIEAARAPAPDPDARWRRVVIGVDPPASTGGDSCGIVVCVKDEEGVVSAIADLTQGGLSPEAWARRVAEAAALYGAGLIVAEKNQGGDMVASNLRGADADLPVKLVHARPSKAARAEPIALRFETGRARLAGRFPELEDQLCALTWSGYQAPGSPDRADAMVWAMTELFEKERAEPRIRLLWSKPPPRT